MKFILKIILIAGISAIVQLFLPFWSIAVVAFVVCLVVSGNGFSAFFSGFLAIIVLWGLIATIIDMSTSSILSSKIAQVLPLGGNILLLTLLTALIGGLVGGFGALSGNMLRAIFVNEKKTGYYS